MDLAAGTMVTPNVRLVRMLGEGGMGSVWVADHLSLNTQVAVKFISAEILDAHPVVRERFNREASLSAQIKSPHVVQTFDHGMVDDSIPYIVMELLDGESLGDRLERVGTLSLDETVAVVEQASRALSKAHRLAIVHRDIKPDNLFLTTDADDDDIYLKVLDFGVAKQTGVELASVTTTGTMVGTPEYMSPEQALSAKDVDEQADLWALAVVAYRCLTGTVPFTGETLGSLCVAIAHGDFAPAGELCDDLPTTIDEWFARALNTNRKQRFASARQLARTLTAAAAGESPSDDEASSNAMSLAGAALASAPGDIQAGGEPASSDSASADTPSSRSPGGRQRAIVGSDEHEAVASAKTVATDSRTFGGASISPPGPATRGRSMLAMAALITLGVGGGIVAIVSATNDAGETAAVGSASEAPRPAADDSAADDSAVPSAGTAPSASANAPRQPATGVTASAAGSAGSPPSASSSASASTAAPRSWRPPPSPAPRPPTLPRDRGF
jgi:serine/threonine-protein kinase